MAITKFEQDLKFYFPDIYKLHEMGKDEPYLWDLVNLLVEMKVTKCTGFVRINYSKGHIDAIQQLTDHLAFKRQKGLTDKQS